MVIPEIIFNEPQKTFMEILKVHNKEVPFANLLAFFFNPKEEHNLETLFIDALLESNFTHKGENANNETCIGKIVYNKNEVKVKTEVLTHNKKRIDILIISDVFVFCIEFKINHDLNNPLEDYKQYIEKEFPNKHYYYFILTPYVKEVIGSAKEYFEKNNEFKQIILSHFIKNVNEKLQELYPTYESENMYYKYYFKDFIQTVENRKIRSKRHDVFTFLKEIINEKIKPFNCEFHKKGFLEIRLKHFNLKIRIKNSGWQIEKWFKDENGKWFKDEKIVYIEKNKNYNDIVNEVEKIINNTYN